MKILHRQILLDHFFTQVRHGPGGGDGSALENGKGVSEFLAEIEILFNEEDAHLAFGAEHFDSVTDLINDVGLDAFGGFVEDEELGLGKQGTGDGELLLLTTAQHAAFAGKELFKNREEGKNAVEQAFDLAFGATGDGADVEVLFNSKMREDIASLRDVAKAESGAFFGSEAVEFVADEVDVAALRGHETDDGAESGGLADSVAAHEAEDGFLRHVEVDAAQDATAADGGVESAKF